MRAVPDEHKKFLADLVWVHEEVSVDFRINSLYEKVFSVAIIECLIAIYKPTANSS